MSESTSRAAAVAGLASFVFGCLCACGASEPTAEARAAFESAAAQTRAGRHSAALRSYKEALELSPQWPEALEAMVDAAMRTDDWASAIEGSEALLAGDPEHAEARWTLGYSKLKSGDLAGARRAAEELASSDVAGSMLALLEAEVAFEEGDLAAARAAAERGLALDAKDAHLRFIVAVALEEGGDEISAIGELRRTIQDDPGHQGARDHLATILARRGLQNEADEQRRLRDLVAQALAPVTRKAPPAEREATYERVCEALPDYAFAWRQLGRARMELGRAADAEAAFERALAADAGQLDLHVLLAEALRAQGKDKEADKHEALARGAPARGFGKRRP